MRPMVHSDAKCNPVDSIGSSTKSRVSHSERPPSARFPGKKTARREGISSPFSDAGGCTSPQNSGMGPSLNSCRESVGDVLSERPVVIGVQRDRVRPTVLRCPLRTAFRRPPGAPTSSPEHRSASVPLTCSTSRRSRCRTTMRSSRGTITTRRAPGRPPGSRDSRSTPSLPAAASHLQLRRVRPQRGRGAERRRRPLRPFASRALGARQWVVSERGFNRFSGPDASGLGFLAHCAWTSNVLSHAARLRRRAEERSGDQNGVHPAALRFYTVAYCTPS